MTSECPTPEELARAVSEGALEAVAQHAVSCDTCRPEWDGANRLRSLAQALPFEAPAAERVLAVRARVMEQAEAARRRTVVRTGLYAAFAVAAAAVLAIGLRGPVRAPVATELAPRYHGAVVALNGARWSRLSAAPDEVVRLESGTIHVEVTPLRPGERFRVQAGDGEVEVRGTAFDVDVEAGHMTRVAVEHGRVEVRGSGAPQALLGAGEKWRAAERAPPHDVGAGAPESTARVLTAPHIAAHPSQPVPKPVPAGNASPVVEAPELAERTRSVAPSAPPSPPPVAVPSAAPPSSVAPHAVPPVATAAPDEDRAREEERRERRDERRERHDQRRWR